MLSYHSSLIDKKANTFWLNTAIHFAKAARAHLYPRMQDDSKDRNVLKRLWWCCILRDRIMALGFRGQLQIKGTDFDFTQPGFVESDFSEEIWSSTVYDATTKQVLVQLAGSLCELAVALNSVFLVLDGGKLPVSDEFNPSTEEMNAWTLGLDAWYEKAFAKFCIPTTTSGANQSLTLFSNMMYIYYKYVVVKFAHVLKGYLIDTIVAPPKFLSSITCCFMFSQPWMTTTRIIRMSLDLKCKCR